MTRVQRRQAQRENKKLRTEEMLKGNMGKKYIPATYIDRYSKKPKKEKLKQPFTFNPI